MMQLSQHEGIEMSEANKTNDLLQALEALVSLHHDWDKGNAYVTVAFYEKNKKAIEQANAAIAQFKATGGAA